MTNVLKCGKHTTFYRTGSLLRGFLWKRLLGIMLKIVPLRLFLFSILNAGIAKKKLGDVFEITSILIVDIFIST